jgi:hypothetical protein
MADFTFAPRGDKKETASLSPLSRSAGKKTLRGEKKAQVKKRT